MSTDQQRVMSEAKELILTTSRLHQKSERGRILTGSLTQGQLLCSRLHIPHKSLRENFSPDQRKKWENESITYATMSTYTSVVVSGTSFVNRRSLSTLHSTCLGLRPCWNSTMRWSNEGPKKIYILLIWRQNKFVANKIYNIICRLQLTVHEIHLLKTWFPVMV